MYYTGIGLHKKTYSSPPLMGDGKWLKGQFKKRNDLNIQYFDDLVDDTNLVIKSMTSWYWLYDLLTEKGLNVNGEYALLQNSDFPTGQLSFTIFSMGYKLMVASISERD